MAYHLASSSNASRMQMPGNHESQGVRRNILGELPLHSVTNHYVSLQAELERNSSDLCGPTSLR